MTMLAVVCASAVLLGSCPRTAVAEDAKPIVLTGSYLPCKIKQYGHITDGPLNVTVIGRTEMQTIGAANVAQVLARQPDIKLRGR